MNTNAPSLQDMAGITIVASVCNEINVCRNDAIYLASLPNTIIEHIRATLMTRFQTFNLPSPIRKRLASFIAPMAEQITLWIKSAARVLKHPQIPFLFSWTSQGTLDQRSTATDLLRNEEINLTDRFGLACFYCLETEIYLLWDKIEEPKSAKLRERLNLNNIILQFWILRKVYPDGVITAFLLDIRPKPFDIPSSTLKKMVRAAFANKNLLAVEYFWPKLTAGEKISFTSSHLPTYLDRDYMPYHSTWPNIYHFIFSTMDTGNLSGLLENYCYQILRLFLCWPWLDHFFEYAGLCWNFLSLKEFQNLLEDIIILNYGDHYSELFEEFWMQSPISLKRFMVNTDFDDLLKHLHNVAGDADKISLFLKHTSLEEKNKIIFSNSGIGTCGYFYFRKKWFLFRRFLSECLTTAELVVKFCIEFLKYLKIDKSELLKDADVIIHSLLKERSREGNCCCEKIVEL